MKPRLRDIGLRFYQLQDIASSSHSDALENPLPHCGLFFYTYLRECQAKGAIPREDESKAWLPLFPGELNIIE